MTEGESFSRVVILSLYNLNMFKLSIFKKLGAFAALREDWGSGFIRFSQIVLDSRLRGNDREEKGAWISVAIYPAPGAGRE